MKTVVFGINIDHVKKIVNAFNEEGIPAVHLSSDFDNRTRDRVINDFRDGKVKILANVNIVTEGFDLPAIEAVMLVRPTKSLSLYLQMVGRGLRPAEGKDRAIILDHADCVFTHGFPEQDRIWTLKGWKKSDGRDIPATKIKFRDVETGDEYEPRDLPPHVTEIELVEVDADEFRKAELDKLFELQKEQEYKPGWVWYQFLEKYKIPTKSEINYVQQKAGYKKRWIYYQKKQFGYTN
jgi:superfamily II DNA or RNA helicase